MAGRASRLKTPDRPSRKGILLILHFETDVKRLIKEGKGYDWPRPKRCPNPECRSARVWGHGYVLRYFDGISRGVWLKRCRCPDCGSVHTCRPKGFYKGFQYAVKTILRSLLTRIYRGKWMKGISHQLQHYWFRGFRIQASRLRNKNPPGYAELRGLIMRDIIPATHGV
jgi:hypothetical protein